MIDPARPDGSPKPPFRLAQRLAQGGGAALVAALDHLLEQNAWARTRLAPHMGRTVMIRVDARTPSALPAPTLLAVITEDGRLRASGMHDPAAGPAVEPAVTVLLRPSLDAAFDFFRDGAAGLSRHLRLEGDVMLAGALGEIARHLRWDAVEDLSRVTGDVAAERIARTARSGVMAARGAGARLRAGAARYLAGESGGRLVERDALSIFEARIDGLEHRVAALASRMPGKR